jgi:hypothetical protein
MKYGVLHGGGEAREHRGEVVDGRRLTLAGTTLPIPTDAARFWLLTVGRPTVGEAAALGTWPTDRVSLGARD